MNKRLDWPEKGGSRANKIVIAINETIKIMKQIDEVIDAHGGWPIK